LWQNTISGGNEMKRIIFLIVIALVLTMAVSAQYVVEEVRGAQQAVGAGWENLRVGQTISADTVVRTQLGSLTVKSGDLVLTIGAREQGILSDLLVKSLSAIVGSVSEADAEAIRSGTSRLVTASARASDAAAGIGLEE
jgi:hypothetical protein